MRPGARAPLTWRCHEMRIWHHLMTTPSVDRRIAQLAARQFGVFSRQQAIAADFDPQAIRYRLSSGRWERVAHNVFRLAGVPDGWHQRLLVACLSWGPPAAISHRAAGRLMHLAGLERELVELTVPPNRRGAGTGTVHRSRLTAADVEIIEGIRVTKAARTLIDIAAVVHRDVVEEALDDALRRGLVSISVLRRRLEEVGGRGGRRGVALMRELIEDRTQEGVPRSVFETRMVRLLKRSGLPEPSRQHEVIVGGRTVAVLDFAFPDRRVGIETDGYRWHSGLARWRRDRRRGNELVALGWRMVHITWDELKNQPEQVVRSIRRVLTDAEVLSSDAVISSPGDKTSGGPRTARATCR